MSVEKLYTPKGAGHNAPEDDRRGYVKPGDRLVEVFKDWLYTFPSQDSSELDFEDETERAAKMMPDLEGVSPEEINALLTLFDGQPNPDIFELCVGSFISLAYNLIAQKDIIFDNVTNEHGIRYIGEHLGKDKRLIICPGSNILDAGSMSKGKIVNYSDGQILGAFAGGLVVNYGRLAADSLISAIFGGQDKDVFGEGSSGVVINFGYADNIGRDSSGILINFGEAKFMGGRAKGIVIAARDPEVIRDDDNITLREADCREIPNLWAYLTTLKTIMQPDIPREDVFKALDGLDVKRDIMNILKAGGYDA